MKKLALFFASAFLHSLMVGAQPAANSLLPQVDKRVELLSIVYRLAKAKEFKDTLNAVYTKAIHDHFDQYSDHPLITYVSKMADSLQKDNIDIGYWEIPSLAVHLSQPPKLESLVPFNDTVAGGWDNRTLLKPELVTLIKQFYKDAKCEAFFKSQEAYYTLINQQYEKQGIKLNKGWIKNFFSLPVTENYYTILNLQGFGDGDYLRVDFQNNRRNTHTLFGCGTFDKNGVPVSFANQMFARSNLHEYIHGFTNQLIDQNISELQKPAETLLANPEVFKIVENTFYGNWQYLLYESLVRACSIRYIMNNPEIKSTAEKEISAQEKAGFLWMKGLVNELGIYESDRKKYKDLGSFMPELNNHFKKIAEEMKNAIHN